VPTPGTPGTVLLKKSLIRNVQISTVRNVTLALETQYKNEMKNEP
jgi:hypothetical protein